MLKTMVLRKRHEKMLADAATLRAQLTAFKTRETDLAAQVEAATTDEEIAAAAAAVAEMEAAQKSAQERLDIIISEAETLQNEIAAAEAAAEAAAAEPGAAGDEGRASSASFQRRCQEFQRTGRMVYQNARSMIMRAAVTTGTNGVIGPTGVGGINDAAGNTVSDFIDLMKITDATGVQMINGLVATLDEKTKKCIALELINVCEID
jgi:membrane protein involved in colicin uptake